MTTSGQYLSDILDIVPDYSIWKIHGTTDQLDSLRMLFDDIDARAEGAFLVVELTKEKKEKIRLSITSDQIEEKIIHMEFWLGDKKIFAGYDYLEYGSIAPEFSLKNEFKVKYIDNDLCTILKD